MARYSPENASSDRRNHPSVHDAEATVLFALTWLAQRPGYVDDQIQTLGLVLGLIAEGALAVGGFIGGSIVFVYGNRVLKGPETPVPDALVPGRIEPQKGPGASGSTAIESRR